MIRITPTSAALLYGPGPASRETPRQDRRAGARPSGASPSQPVGILKPPVTGRSASCG